MAVQIEGLAVTYYPIPKSGTSSARAASFIRERCATSSIFSQRPLKRRVRRVGVMR
ncbi:hypothetical protein [Mesorhizobium sp. B4-1-1]|uniref:hypothetical protein n=1 Tax=Mesorhizobium sp. B4-1-1 TaxID=2589890 RepID=UPI0015E3B93B|nr:hypothetical protein [Mesorhizobium sp. B4-1-1]